MRYLQNPNEGTLRIDQVRKDVAFVAYKGGEMVMAGIFMSGPEVLQDESWSPIPAVDSSGRATNIDPYDAGIVPSRHSGNWEEGTGVLLAELA